MAANTKVKMNAPEFHPEVTNKEDEGYVIVTNLPYSVTVKDIFGFFQATVGLVKSIWFLPGDPYRTTAAFKIAFCNYQDARKAYYRFHNTRQFGREIKLVYCITKRNTPSVTRNTPPLSNVVPTRTVLVSQLECYITAKEILDHFKKAVGPIVSVVFKLSASGIYDGQAELVFRDPSDARKSLFYNDSLFYGKRIKLHLLNDSQVELTDEKSDVKKFDSFLRMENDAAGKEQDDPQNARP